MASREFTLTVVVLLAVLSTLLAGCDTLSEGFSFNYGDKTFSFERELEKDPALPPEEEL